MFLSSLHAQRAVASGLKWRTASVAPLRAFASLARGGLVAPYIAASATVGVRVAAATAPFSSWGPSLVSRKRTVKAVAATTKKKAPVVKTEAKRTAKVGTKAKDTKTASKAKKRVGPRTVSLRHASLLRATTKAKLAKARATAKAIKARTVAKAKAAKARVAAKAKEVKARVKAKAKATKAREAARNEKNRALIHAFNDLRRSIPKRVSNPLSLFYSDNKINVPIPQAVNIINDKWRSASESTKRAYKAKAKANMERFESEFSRWHAGLTPQQKEIAASHKFQKTLMNYQARALRRVKGRPATNYTNFYKEMYPAISAKIKNDQPALSGQGVMLATCKAAAAKWRTMSAEQKQAYAVA